MQNKSTAPSKWWQWFLIYPTLATTIIASIPTFVELRSSAKLGVDYGKSQEAIEQRDAWSRNLSCGQAPYDWYVTPNNVKVDATICRSGDVLVRYELPMGKGSYKWVEVGGSSSETISSIIGETYFLSVAENNRENLFAQSATVICQRWIDNRRILRRISVPGRGCFDEIVDTYTGNVERQTSAPCTSC